jgi:Zn-finger nucleic acid-binding protein
MSHGLECPRCSGDLVVEWLGELEAAICDRCRGTWLHNRACGVLVGGELSDQAKAGLLELHAESAEEHEGGYRVGAKLHRADGETLSCPVCRRPLEQLVTTHDDHGVVARLEICPRDGTWFDRGEAWTLYQGHSLKRLAPEVRAQQNRADREFYNNR